MHKPQQHIEVTPVSAALGAEISGIDVSRELSSDVIAEVRQTLLDHLVIFFRGQHLTPDQHKSFGQCFGALSIDKFVRGPHGHPEIMPVIKEPDDKRNFGGVWHSDVSFLDEPAMGSILYARQVPSFGGDTLFSNMYLAYEHLSPGLKAALDDLRAVHCADVSYDRRRMDIANRQNQDMQYTEKNPSDESSVHPVVRTHPETGKRALYVNCAYTQRFENMTEAESTPLLQFLYHHLSRPDFTCRFRWQQGAIAF